MSEAVVCGLRLPRCLAGEAAAARGRGRRAPPADPRRPRPVLLEPGPETHYFRMDQAAPGLVRWTATRQKENAVTLPRIPTFCDLRSNGSGRGHGMRSGPGCRFFGGPPPSHFMGASKEVGLCPFPRGLFFFNGGRMGRTRNILCAPDLERWGVREEGLFL